MHTTNKADCFKVPTYVGDIVPLNPSLSAFTMSRPMTTHGPSSITTALRKILELTGFRLPIYTANPATAVLASELEAISTNLHTLQTCLLAPESEQLPIDRAMLDLILTDIVAALEALLEETDEVPAEDALKIGFPTSIVRLEFQRSLIERMVTVLKRRGCETLQPSPDTEDLRGEFVKMMSEDKKQSVPGEKKQQATRYSTISTRPPSYSSMPGGADPPTYTATTFERTLGTTRRRRRTLMSLTTPGPARLPSRSSTQSPVTRFLCLPLPTLRGLLGGGKSPMLEMPERITMYERATRVRGQLSLVPELEHYFVARPLGTDINPIPHLWTIFRQAETWLVLIACILRTPYKPPPPTTSDVLIELALNRMVVQLRMPKHKLFTFTDLYSSSLSGFAKVLHTLYHLTKLLSLPASPIPSPLLPAFAYEFTDPLITSAPAYLHSLTNLLQCRHFLTSTATSSLLQLFPPNLTTLTQVEREFTNKLTHISHFSSANDYPQLWADYAPRLATLYKGYIGHLSAAPTPLDSVRGLVELAEERGYALVSRKILVRKNTAGEKEYDLGASLSSPLKRLNAYIEVIKGLLRDVKIPEEMELLLGALRALDGVSGVLEVMPLQRKGEDGGWDWTFPVRRTHEVRTGVPPLLYGSAE